MKNGSIEFVVCTVEILKKHVVSYKRFEYLEDYEDYGFASKITSKGVS